MPVLGFPTAGYPGPYDVYVPNHEASGGLLVGYSRNAADFPVNNYIEIFPTKQMFGVYASYTSRNAARIISPTDAEHTWADGEACPPGLNNLESFAFLTFKTTRRAYTFTLGEMTVEQMSFDLLMTNTNDMAQQCMTARTLLTQNALAGTNWGTYPTGNTAAVDGQILQPGQNWTTGSVGFSNNQGPNIKISLQYGIRTIHQQTIGSVREDKLILVVNPVTAQAMASSTEIQDYIKQSQFALAQLRGDAPNQNGIWNLPTHLYGVKIVVEDAMRVSSRKGAAVDTIGYVMPNGVAYLLAAPGKLVGLAGSRSYSTIQMFMFKDEMTLETLYDINNKRYLGRVISNYVVLTVTTLSGFYFTTCLT
jgi:hypothetical protein